MPMKSKVARTTQYVLRLSQWMYSVYWWNLHQCKWFSQVFPYWKLTERCILLHWLSWTVSHMKGLADNCLAAAFPVLPWPPMQMHRRMHAHKSFILEDTPCYLSHTQECCVPISLGYSCYKINATPQKTRLCGINHSE